MVAQLSRMISAFLVFTSVGRKKQFYYRYYIPEELDVRMLLNHEMYPVGYNEMQNLCLNDLFFYWKLYKLAYSHLMHTFIMFNF
jgi:hypothetical protein